MSKRSERLDSNWQSAREELVSAARNAGVDAGIMVKIAGFESGFDPSARPIARDAARNQVRQFDGAMAISSAHGYGQFINGTWAGMVRQYGEKYGVENAANLSNADANRVELRGNSALQAAMLAEFTRENVAKGARLGGPDPDANVYAFHNLGDVDATRFLIAMRQNPGSRVDSVLTSGVVRGNPALYGDGSRTLAAAYAAMGQQMDRYEGYARQVSSVVGPFDFKRNDAVKPDAIAAPADPARRAGTLELHDSGPEVRQLQQKLDRLGYRDPEGKPLKIDSDFGSNTDHAVRAFQGAHGLRVDGIVGDATRAALLQAERTPLLSEHGHPQHGLYQQARHGLSALPAGSVAGGREADNTAAALAHRAHASGLARIDHVLVNTRGDGMLAVQGQPTDPARHVAWVDRALAATQPVARSTELLAANDAVRLHASQAEVQTQHQEHRNGLTMAIRP